MELSQISKTRKKGRGNVPDYRKALLENPNKTVEEIADKLTAAAGRVRGSRAAAAPPAAPPAAPGTPYNKIKPWHLKAPKYAAGALGVGAVGGGAYLYRRKRLERSLS